MAMTKSPVADTDELRPRGVGGGGGVTQVHRGAAP